LSAKNAQIYTENAHFIETLFLLCAFLADKHAVTSTQSLYVLNLDCMSDSIEEIGTSNDVLAQKCMKR
jgi:hypothetical protein